MIKMGAFLRVSSHTIALRTSVALDVRSVRRDKVAWKLVFLKSNPKISLIKNKKRVFQIPPQKMF